MPLQPDTLSVRRTAYAPRELSRWATLNLANLPFETVLSLEPLIDFYRSAAGRNGMSGVRLIAAEIERALARAPDLARPLIGADAGTDVQPGVLQRNREALDLLMTSVFPPALRDREVGAALVPFEFRAIYGTPVFEQLFTQPDGTINGRVHLDLRTFTYGKILSAYLHILHSVYGLDVPFEYPVIFTVADPETGLDRHFDITTDLRFVRVEPVGEVPALDAERRRKLLNNLSDLTFWRELFPPNSFRFQGFTILHADDITEHRVLSLLENDLVDGERIMAGQNFQLLAERLRTLLHEPRIEMGLAALDGAQLLVLNEPSMPFERPFARPTSRYRLDELKGSLFRRCMDERLMLIVEDLGGATDGTPLEARMRQAGVRNLVVAPLLVQEQPAGVLYLWAREPGTLHALNVMQLQESLPLFASAVRRGLEALQNRVRNVIMGEYTTIHPSVEWRFRQAALNYIQRREQGRAAEIEPIVFHDVYPLFAATDIRSSSTHRNEAIREDLLDHLEQANDVLESAAQAHRLPLLVHLRERIDRYRTALRNGFTSGDETAVRDFLRQDVDPILTHLRQLDDEMRRRVEAYQACTDAETGSFYTRCRAFENSVARINQTISAYLDAEEAKLQAFLPHYFEKHQTDGVAFSIYAGASLVEQGDFDPAYVRLLRLWQLYVMCGIARRVEPLKHSLDVPLETTHLVLVQDTPVSIRYRFDETRFDVDGAQHIRYEIMKQRVEKACLRDSDERLTQPERLAVVYAQDREGEEYARYIDYLIDRGLLAGPVESLELADLQGMKGLRAFRVAVALDAPLRVSEIAPEALEPTVRNGVS